MTTNLTLKNVPDELYGALKRRAAENRRSINSEAITLLETAIRELSIDPDDFVAQIRRHRDGGWAPSEPRTVVEGPVGDREADRSDRTLYPDVGERAARQRLAVRSQGVAWPVPTHRPGVEERLRRLEAIRAAIGGPPLTDEILREMKEEGRP